jgi:amino acid adenylation domain-containing protein
MFEQQVCDNPEAIAVVCHDQSLSYLELNLQANRLAHYLIAVGVKPDDRVAICVERSLAMVIGLLAILKAGAAYVPLDPAYPAQRLRLILNDAAPPVLLCDAVGRAALDHAAPAHLKVIDLDSVGLVGGLPQLWAQQLAINPDPARLGLTSHHLAYVIYTSGSTGTPKGVMVEHQQVTRLFHSTQADYGFNRHDTWCLFHSFAFDFSVWELWGALGYGGRLLVVPQAVARSSRDFYQLLCQQRVTVLNQTPSAFKALIEAHGQEKDRLEHELRYVIFGGEALEPSILKPWYDNQGESGPQLVNMYGITETTVHVTYRALQPRDSSYRGSPIGRRLEDLQIYLLDSYGQPVPLGTVGEMYVGGAGVARGYLNRPELTAERFVVDVFSSVPEARLYKTGDLARYLWDGQLEFLGRNDHQVKIRGFRIELGEIEARLADYPGVSQAVVVADEEESREKRLLAYVVVAPEAETAALDLAGELRAHLSACLPEYMVPVAFVRLPALPLTPNGKLDREALPLPDGEAYARRQYEPPQGEVEQTLATLWQELLGVESVGRHDNFFELGGHSLLAVRLLSHVRSAFNVRIELSTLFNYPQLALFARKVLIASIEQEFDSIEFQNLVAAEDRKS